MADQRVSKSVEEALISAELTQTFARLAKVFRSLPEGECDCTVRTMESVKNEILGSKNSKERK